MRQKLRMMQIEKALEAGPMSAGMIAKKTALPELVIYTNVALMMREKKITRLPERRRERGADGKLSKRSHTFYRLACGDLPEPPAPSAEKTFPVRKLHANHAENQRRDMARIRARNTAGSGVIAGECYHRGYANW